MCRLTSYASHRMDLYHFRLGDNDVFNRHVLMAAAIAGFDAADFVDDLGAGRNLAEYAVTPALGTWRGVIEEIIVGNIDEELRSRRMRVAGARHRHCVTIVLQFVVGPVLDRRAGGFLFHAGLEASALNHEAVDHAMEDRVVIVAAFDVGDEIFRRDGRFGGVELDTDDAVIGVQVDHDIDLIWLQVCRKAEGVRLR